MHINVTTIIEHANAAWAKCDEKWIPGGLADTDDVDVFTIAISALERAKPQSRDEWFNKWRLLAKNETELGDPSEARPQLMTQMISELAAIGR
jgi:hypothetical protein